LEFLRANTEAIKGCLALLALALVVVWPRLRARHARAALVSLTLLAAINYTRADVKFLSRQVDAYDLIHYYLSAKYFDEIGYYGLYPAILLADHDNGPLAPRLKSFHEKLPTGYRYPIDIAAGVARGREYRSERFTPARWAEFEHDFLHLQREHELSKKRWQDLIQDRGFNGTPYWIEVAAPIAQLVPVEAIKLLCWLDVVLLGAALWLVHRAYGLETALFGTLFLLVTYSTRWPHLTWAYLRYDWLAALLAATALLKLERPWLAGICAGYAAAMRLFPVAWLLSSFSAFCANLFRRSRQGVRAMAGELLPSRPAMALGLGAAACILAFVALVALHEGSDAIREHAEVMSEHTSADQLTSRRVGLAIALVYDGTVRQKMLTRAQKQAVDEMKLPRTALALLLIAMLGYGLRRKPLDESFALGTLPFFLLTTASYYYYVARLTLVALHAPRLGDRFHRVGLAAVLGLDVVSSALHTALPGERILLVGHLSWGLALYSLGVAGWYAWNEWSFSRTPR
jgi:hypothetical protein